MKENTIKFVTACLESTYLKTPAQAGISEDEDFLRVKKLAEQAIKHQFKVVMIRSNHLSYLRDFLNQNDSVVKLGTVIDFPHGTSSTQQKMEEAKRAIDNGADELDFVIDYTAFKNGQYEYIGTQLRKCTELCLSNDKVIKWIIEIAALTDNEIAQITSLIRKEIETFFADEVDKVFVKSSTGFYKRDDDGPVGATISAIKIMKSNSGDLPLKAAGGIRNLSDAKKMIDLGVTRIGTSSAKEIISNKHSSNEY